MNRAKARSQNVGSSRRHTDTITELLRRRRQGRWFYGSGYW